MASVVSYRHAGITVRDLARARRFYSDLLGLKEIPRPDLGFPGIWYGIGACQLHLMVPPEGHLAGEPEGPFAGRVRHLALGGRGLGGAHCQVEGGRRADQGIGPVTGRAPPGLRQRP